MLIRGLLITGLLFIFYQDLRFRAVYWLVFPLLLVLILMAALQQQSFSDLLLNSEYNLAFLLSQFLILFLYFSVKAKTWVNITSGLIGWGDILFLLCIAFYLSPVNYLFFYISSLCVVLLITLAGYLAKREQKIQVPLAGLQAVLFAAVLLADWRMDKFTITNDFWLLSYLT